MIARYVSWRQALFAVFSSCLSIFTLAGHYECPDGTTLLSNGKCSDGSIARYYSYNLKVTPVSLDFGTVVTGQRSGQKTVTLTNLSTSTVRFTRAITVPAANFSGSTNCTSNGVGSLAAGQSCLLYIEYAPTAAGQHAGVATITTDEISPYTVALNGTGTGTTTTTTGSCDPSLGADMVLNVPYLTYGGAKYWAKLALASNSGGTMVFRLTGYGASSLNCTSGATLSSALTLSLPSVAYGNANYSGISLSLVPTTGNDLMFQYPPATSTTGSLDANLVGKWSMYIPGGAYINYAGYIVYSAGAVGGELTIDSSGRYTWVKSWGTYTGQLSSYTPARSVDRNKTYWGVITVDNDRFYAYYEPSDHSIVLKSAATDFYVYVGGK